MFNLKNRFSGSRKVHTGTIGWEKISFHLSSLLNLSQIPEKTKSLSSQLYYTLALGGHQITEKKKV